MNNLRILGLDVGEVLIGVAVSDPSEIIAQGLDSIRRVNLKKDVETIKNLINEYETDKIVVGLPKMMSGEIGIQAQKVLAFVESLKKIVEIPIIMWDERLTTVSANKVLIEADVSRKKRKKVADKLSAILILQGYLDSHG
ncbi:MAG: putative pre6S rRNA nuclease [Candidatus Poribacteria bacterium]|nr:putative pre6S rRNA nuclease [Candidatus Poribacteria bacterium]